MNARHPPKVGERAVFLYEDSDIVFVEKPAGMNVIAPDAGRGGGKSLLDIVTAHIQGKNRRGRAALVHRIDRDTSGIMVFAKNARAKKALMDNWDTAVEERGYVAIVEGEMPNDEGLLDSWLMENRAGQVYEVAPGMPKALRAVTRFRVLEKSRGHSLLELKLETGRKHQIRAQLAAAGHPVAGDFRYGAADDPLGRLCLHAHLLVLVHPFSHEKIRAESPVPEEFKKVVAGAASGLPSRKDQVRGRKNFKNIK